MTKSHPTAVESAQLYFECPKCHAEAGRWCIRAQKTGALGSYTYDARITPQNLHAERFNEATKAGALPLL